MFKLCLRMAKMLIIGFVLIAYSRPILASQTDTSVGFSIRAVTSEKQINKKVSYFDLMLSPSEEHVLEIDIFNISDSPMNASIIACTSGTNSGGVIDYDNTNATDDSLKVSFADIASVNNSFVEIPANSSQRVSIDIKMPDNTFDGMLLGGIVVKKIETEDLDIPDNTDKTSIRNEYCYILATQIRVNDSLVEPDFKLRYVEPKLSNYHTSITANIQNYEAAIANDIKIDAKVYYNNESEPKYSSSSSNFDVAPNSNFDYIIPCESKLSAGNYRLLLTATLGSKLWEFEEAFTITAPVANSINEQAVNVPAVNYYRIATIFLSIFLIIILICIILWFVFVNNKKKSQKDE